MKKVLFTVALGLFFATFTHAQSTLSKTAEAKAELIVENNACKPDCAKDCCTGKNADAKAANKNNKSCNTKATKKSCATKAKSCSGKKRPNSCKH